MSYWKHQPGPFWSHFLQSLNPFARQTTGILEPEIAQRKRHVPEPARGHLVELGAEHARALAEFLQTEYVKFPKARVSLSEERIRQGFQLDHWLGLAWFLQGTIIACILSRPTGTLFLNYQSIPNTDVLDFFCVAKSWRKKGIASYLIQEIILYTATKGRLVHFFQHEGGMITSVPPIWQGRYVWRKRGLPSESGIYLRKMQISERMELGDMVHMQYFSEEQLRTRPRHITGDSDIYVFGYMGYTIYMCITDTFHRSHPERWKMGELLWIQCVRPNTPQDIQRLAIETLVDHCSFDMIFMDSGYPHETQRGWKKDSAFSWYMQNFHSGTYFGLRPYLIL